MITQDKRNLVNLVAGQYLAEPKEGDFYDAYVALKELQSGGNGDAIAMYTVDTWGDLGNITADSLIGFIEGGVSYMEKFETKIPAFLLNIDWKVLKEQKQVLLAAISHVGEGVIADNLTGILHLIDAIQDYAVDGLGIKEDTVFNLEEEEKEVITRKDLEG